MTSDDKREKVLAYYRRYYELHREKLKAKRRERYLANRDKELAASRRYNHRHREELKAYKREYRAHRKQFLKRRRIRIVSEILARIKQSLIDNKETNARRARQVDIAKGLAQMGDFVPRHKKFRDPND